MPVIASRISPQSEAFKANAAHLLARVEKFCSFEQAVIAHSSQQAERFAKRGQLLPRERVARLLDHGASFLELSTLAGFGMHDDDGASRAMGGGSIVGIGIVSGKRVLVLASDSAIKGGAISPMGLKKSLRAQEIAKENKLPLIISSSRAARTCFIKARCSSRAAGSSRTRRGCLRRAFLKSQSCTARPRRAAPIFRACRTM